MDYKQLLEVAIDRVQIEIMEGSCSGEQPLSSTFEAIGMAETIKQRLINEINNGTNSSEKKSELAIKLAAIYLRISIETFYK